MQGYEENAQQTPKTLHENVNLKKRNNKFEEINISYGFYRKIVAKKFLVVDCNLLILKNVI